MRNAIAWKKARVTSRLPRNSSILITLIFKIMLKKISVAIVLSVIMLGVGLVLNSKSVECIHSHENHENCAELAQARAGDHNCLACGSIYDEGGFCPNCDYMDCPNCGNHTLNRLLNYCFKCGEPIQGYACEKCGRPYELCDCDEGK